MLEVDTARLVGSRELYLAIIRENPELRIERWADGTLVLMPPTGSETSRQNAEIVAQLASWNRARAGVVFDSSGGFDLPDGSTLSTDAAWITGERWSRLTVEQRQAFSPLSPDFVVELVSRSDRVSAARNKVADFIANGSRLAWLIDPLRRVVEVHRPGRAPEILANPRFVDGEDVLPGFVLDLAPVFGI
jgi:Uma2 family endonuclease